MTALDKDKTGKACPSAAKVGRTRTNHVRVPRGESSIALILATERLVATRGAEGASLREITAAAGVRNASAVHYHFGTREKLILAVFRHRIEAVNDRRLRFLRASAAGPLRGQERRLVEALVRPLATELEPRPEGNFYLRFLERTLRERIGLTLGPVAEDWVRGWNDTETLLRGAMSVLPAALANLRLRMVRDQAVSGLASIEALSEHSTISGASRSLHVEALIDAVTAMVTSSISKDTQVALQAAGKSARI